MSININIEVVTDHTEMSAFVSVAIAILLCTTIWDKPKTWALKRLNGVAKDEIQDLKEDIVGVKDTKNPCNAPNWEYVETAVSEAGKRLEAAVQGWIETAYYILAALFVLPGLAELYLSCSSHFGYWNLLLLLPVLFYLFALVISAISFKLKVSKALKKYKNYLEVNASTPAPCADQNKTDVENLVGDPDRGQ